MKSKLLILVVFSLFISLFSSLSYASDRRLCENAALRELADFYASGFSPVKFESAEVAEYSAGENSEGDQVVTYEFSVSTRKRYARYARITLLKKNCVLLVAGMWANKEAMEDDDHDAAQGGGGE